MRTGLIECEEREKECEVRKIQALASTFDCRMEEGGQETHPAQKGWNYTLKL